MKKIIAVSLLIGVAVFAGCDKPENTPKESTAYQHGVETLERLKQEDQNKIKWSYRESKDKMTDVSIYFAKIKSTNAVNFAFPYSGAQHAKLTLRSKGKNNINVMLSIEKGQILCRSYERCEVMVRFDDGKAVNYTGLGPSDGSSELVFIRNEGEFFSNLKKSKRVKVAIDIYNEGTNVFEFDVGEFDKGKFLK